MREQKKLFYGWYILAVSVLVMALCYAPVVSCASLFISPITKEFGFANSAFTVTKTIASLVGMVVAPFFGKIMAKKYMHAAWVGSLVGVVVVFFAMSFASTLPQFYIISFAQGLFTTSAAMLPVNIVLTNWFQKKRAFIVSIAMAGSGIGGTVLSKVMGTMIVTHGWRYTYRFLAVMILIILVPAVAFVVRRTPEEKDLKPYGADDARNVKAQHQTAEWNVSLGELRKTRLFWIFLFGVSCLSFTSAVIVHVPTAVVSEGYSLETAATISSLYLLIDVPGKILLGWIYDRFGVKAGILFGNCMFFASMILLLFIGSQPMLYVMAVLYGFGQCCSTVGASVITSRTFGSKHYAQIYGLVTMFVNGSYALGAPVIGLFYDLTGTYHLAALVLAVLAVVMTATLFYSYKASRKYIGKTSAV